MTTFANGESGLSVRTKINNVLQHTDGTAGELVINEAGADVDFRVESDTNANALFVDGATGNVGVGVGSPAAKLHIVQTDPAIRLTRTTDFFYGLLSADGFSAYTNTNDNAPIIFKTATNERARIDGAGNLLIGTTSSGGSKLRISGLPTSSAGLSAGDVWNDGGTLKIV